MKKQQENSSKTTAAICGQKLFLATAVLLSLSCSIAPAPQPVGPARPAPRAEKEPGGKLVMASFYGEGDGLHGQKTASGEMYDKNSLTAAHRSLPFGTRVRVTSEKSKKSVVVRINDRGPFVKGRSLDLSARAARELGFVDGGVEQVRLEVLSADDSSSEAPVNSTNENSAENSTAEASPATDAAKSSVQ